MTTAERFRRRQRIEGFFLVILGLFSVVSGLYFQDQQSKQRDCFERKISELTSTLKIRGNLSNQQFAQITALIDGALASKTPAQFRPIKRAYVKEGQRIQRIRANHPIREYPTGSCDGGDQGSGKSREHRAGEASLPWKPFSLS